MDTHKYSLKTNTGDYEFKIVFDAEENILTCVASFFVLSVESWLTCLDVFITDFVL